MFLQSGLITVGVDSFVGNTDKVRIFNNCLTLANSGSVGATFYQPFSFVTSDHVTKLSNTEFTKYGYLFISMIVSRLGEKYSFNREINDDRIKKEKIMLPVNAQDEPDYEYMEQYMRAKEQRSRLRYLEIFRKKILKKQQHENSKTIIHAWVLSFFYPVCYEQGLQPLKSYPINNI